METLSSPPTMGELLSVVEHTPTAKSPGLDGIPFELYRHIFMQYPSVLSFFLEVVQKAFVGDIPPSWQKTRMVLLFKKGDPHLLANWRPLSLINTDAEIFTKILANRFNRVSPSLINPYQTGFMPHRNISDNGWINTTLMANLQKSEDPRVAEMAMVLLDQEKAYDRVHPDYLRAVLQRFRFPDVIIDTLLKLFFQTRISVSVNGFLGAPVDQGRGLRQGDPLSPLLFNLAFEPLLRSILASQQLRGISMHTVPITRHQHASPNKHSHPSTGGDDSPIPWHSPPSLKLLGFADDLAVYLQSPNEWSVLQEILQTYSWASNAKVNIHKTEVVSLSGKSHAEWIKITTELVVAYHTKDSRTAVRYLGYSLFSAPHQLKAYLSKIRALILGSCTKLQGRGLSVQGLAYITNSVILSKLWHLLRVIPVPKVWLDEIRSIVRRFVLPFWPAPSWESICLPKSKGGLGIIDLHTQHHALQMIYIQRILRGKKDTDFVTPWIGYCIYLYTGHHSFLPWLQYPAQFKAHFKQLPTMTVLTKVLTELSSLPHHPQWSGRWYTDIPLRCALLPRQTLNADINTESDISLGYAISAVPLQYLVSDLFQWSYFHQAFVDPVENGSIRSRTGKPAELYRLLQDRNPVIRWDPTIAKLMPS